MGQEVRALVVGADELVEGRHDAAVGGLIGQLSGVKWVFVVMALLVLSQLIPMLWVTDRRMDEPEAAVEAEDGIPVR